MRYMLLAITVSLVAAAPAGAVTLAVGTNVLPGTTTAAEPNLAGTVVQDVIKNFSIGGAGNNVSGSVQNRVVRSVDGTYDFYWRIFDLTFTGRREVSSFDLAGFGATVVGLNGNYATDGLGNVGPNTAFVSSTTPNAVSFQFANTLGSGETSYFFFLDTQARSYAETATYTIGAGNQSSSSFTTFAPGAVPEPATWSMMIAGFAAVGAMMRQRRQRLAVRTV